VHLILEVASSSTRHPGDPGRHIFGEEGGTIGRAPSNPWVLPHNKVSGRHAVITFRGGTFYIQDVSRNGISVTSPEHLLARDRPYPLKHGDRIFIVPYEIAVSIEDSVADAFGPFDSQPPDPKPFQSRPVTPQDSPSLENPFEVVSGDRVLDFLGPATPPSPTPLKPRGDAPTPLGDQHYAPPVVVSAQSSTPDTPAVKDIPPDFNPWPDADQSAPAPGPRPRPGERPPTDRPRDRKTAEPPPVSALPSPPPPPPPVVVDERPPAVSPPPPVSPTPPVGPARPADDLAEMLAGAGLPAAAVTPELIRSFGQILRVVVEGLMEALQARQRIKSEFGMEQTMFRPTDNNPLKFSVNLEDALHNLLVKRNAAYLGPVEAFADAFDDLHDHQLSMFAGLRVAFDGMLSESSPDALQEEFDRLLSKGSLPIVSAKRRYWDLYREKREEMARDPDDAFSRMFGEQFARAYEDHFRRLKAARRKQNRDKPPPEPSTP
jgi:type VI secretion system FHA domain protein